MTTLLAAPVRRLGAPLYLLVGMAVLGVSCGPPYVRKFVGFEDGGAGNGGEGGDGGAGGTGGSGGNRAPDASVSTGGTSGTGGRAGSGGAGGAPDAAGGAGGRDGGPPDSAPDVGGPEGPGVPADSGPDVSQMCVMGVAGEFMNTPFPSQTGKFTVEVDATPAAAMINSIVALSNGAPMTYPGYAVALRFGPTGTIDALNGAGYVASAVTYSGGMTYHFRIVVDVAAHTYAAYVTPKGAAEMTLGTNLAFRMGQATVTSLNSWGLVVQAGSGTATACGFTVQAN